jgi:hypothetical protein
MIGCQQRRLRCGEAKMKTIKMTMRRRMTKTRRQRVAVGCRQVYGGSWGLRAGVDADC